MELHLIRHGETDWNRERRVQGQSESQLTELGIRQATELGQRIGHIRFDSIYCSSSRRTRQTAQHAFPEAQAGIVYMDTLREIFLGPWEGRLYDELAEAEPDSHRHFWQEPHLFRVEGAEDFYMLQRRAIDAIAEIESRHRTDAENDSKIALVSHGALIKSFLCHVEGRSMEQLWEPPRMHNCAHSIVKFSTDGSVNTASIVQYADQPTNEEYK